MDIETLAYPWKPDISVLEERIKQLEYRLENLSYENTNLRFFCQQLYDRLNISSYNSGTCINRP